MEEERPSEKISTFAGEVEKGRRRKGHVPRGKRRGEECRLLEVSFQSICEEIINRGVPGILRGPTESGKKRRKDSA